MKAPVEWLKEFVAIRLSPEKLARRLTMAGSEVVGVERVGGEPVLDLEITPNRADCLSIIGIAREVAAVTGAKLTLPQVRSSKFEVRRKHRTSRFMLRTAFSVRIEDRKGCRRYIGRLIEGVRIGSSPAWMQKRLLACGIRPINNVVDTTNYVLLEYGQPLHAFDYRLLHHGTIIVRRAREKEQLLALDGNDYFFSPNAGTVGALVIADSDRPIAIAGVMGGQETAVNERTTDILLESAWFDPLTVRRTGRALGLTSESSYRFERGVDPEGVELASRRAAQLITEIAGGREAAVHDAGERTVKRTSVSLDGARVQGWLGASISPATVKRTLESLGCAARAAKDGWRITPPSFRRDLQQDVDLIEDLARVVGYERIPDTLPSAAIATRRDGKNSSYHAAYELRHRCASLGLTEFITWSLVSEAEMAKTSLSDSLGVSLRVANPLSRDHLILRPTLLVGLLHAVAHNLAHGVPWVCGFELGNVFSGGEASNTERLRLGLVMAGGQRSWRRRYPGDSANRDPADLFRVKGIVEELVRRTIRKSIRVQPTSKVPWAEPGHAIVLSIDEQPLGVAAQVAAGVRGAFDLKHDVWVVELEAAPLLAPPPPVNVTTLRPFPPVKRDLSIVVSQAVHYVEVRSLIERVGLPLTSRIELVDRYTDSPIPPGHQSLTFAIEYRDPSRTLTAAEVDTIHRRIGEELVRQCGAQLR